MPTTVSTFGVMPVAARPLTTWRSSQPPPAPIQCVTGFQIGSLAFAISTGIIRHAACLPQGAKKRPRNKGATCAALVLRIRDVSAGRLRTRLRVEQELRSLEYPRCEFGY